MNMRCRTEQIVHGIGAIHDIAQQLNVLVVNGRILAAQAGRYGRGFAVVVDRIGELGSSLSGSARDVGDLFEAIQKEANAVGVDFERSAQSVDPTIELANQVERALSNIGKNGGEVLDLARATVGISTANTESSKQVTNCISRTAESIPAIASNASMLAKWLDSTRGVVEQSATDPSGNALEQWTAAGAHIVEFAKRMERAANVQEETFRRLGELLNRLDGK
jgi:methyl-accepting chemotaxis protein